MSPSPIWSLRTLECFASRSARTQQHRIGRDVPGRTTPQKTRAHNIHGMYCFEVHWRAQHIHWTFTASSVCHNTVRWPRVRSHSEKVLPCLLCLYGERLLTLILPSPPSPGFVPFSKCHRTPRRHALLRHLHAHAASRRVLVYKCDVKGAYRLIPMHPLWQMQQATKLPDGQFAINRNNVFGGGASGSNGIQRPARFHRSRPREVEKMGIISRISLISFDLMQRYATVTIRSGKTQTL